MNTVTEEKSLLDYLITAWQIFASIVAARFLIESVIICIRRPWCLLISLLLGSELVLLSVFETHGVFAGLTPWGVLFIFIMTSFYADEYRDEYLKNNNLQAEPLFQYNYIPWYTQVTRIFGCS